MAAPDTGEMFGAGQYMPLCPTQKGRCVGRAGGGVRAVAARAHVGAVRIVGKVHQRRQIKIQAQGRHLGAYALAHLPGQRGAACRAGGHGPGEPSDAAGQAGDGAALLVGGHEQGRAVGQQGLMLKLPDEREELLTVIAGEQDDVA